MKLRHLVETTSLSGLKSKSSREYEGDVLVIGRGGASDILVESTLVSLEHAKLTVRDEKLFIQDQNSLSGIRVNGTVCAEHALKTGDTISVGNLTFSIDRDSEYWVLKEERIERAVEDVEEKVKRIARDLRIENRLPSKSILSAILFILTILACGIAPFLSGSPLFWSSGPLAENHRFLENQCSSCHAKPFERVQDAVCTACHNMSDHSDAVAEVSGTHAAPDTNCTACHQDHTGIHGVIPRHHETCTDCHGNITAEYPDSTLQSVRSFAKHPEFQVTVWKEGSPETTEKIAITTPGLKDTSGLKFSHKAHLEATLKSPKGDVNLNCQDCHVLDTNFQTFKPLSFEASCRDCHSLEFDERLPGNHVPHADPDIVFNYMYAAYARIHLEPEQTAALLPAFSRPRPGQENSERVTTPKFNRAAVLASARETEKELFEKQACFLCHEIEANTNPVEAAGHSPSNYQLRSPSLPHRWYPAARFDHGAHEELQCTECHTGAPDSEVTSDVLLPAIATCQNCHADISTAGKVKTECIDCHSFHDSLSMPPDAKRSLEELLWRTE